MLWQTSLMACCVLVQATVCMAQQGGWHSTVAEAQARAASEGVPVLIHFWTTGCMPCVQMEREVFSDARVQKSLSTNVAAVRANSGTDVALASQFGIRGVPADVIIYPDGKTEHRVGRQGRTPYLKMLDEAGRRKKQPSARTSDSAMAGNPSERSNSAPSAGQANGGGPRELPTPTGGTEELAFNSVETGMDGFCPVYLRQKGSLKLGSDQYETVHQGIRYQFVSEANRLQFLKDPAKYAPQDLGCDPVILTKEHRALAGDVRLRLWFDGRLYLFSSDESQVEFRTRPLRYSQMRSALKAEDIQRTKLQ